MSPSQDVAVVEGGVPEQKHVLRRPFPVVVGVGDEGADRLAQHQAVRELVVDVLHVDDCRGKTAVPAMAGEPFGGVEKILVGDHQVVGSRMRRPQPRRGIEHAAGSADAGAVDDDVLGPGVVLVFENRRVERSAGTVDQHPGENDFARGVEEVDFGMGEVERDKLRAGRGSAGEAQVSGLCHVAAAVVDGEVVEERLVPAFGGAGERLDEQPVGPPPQVGRRDFLLDLELDLPLPVVVADMVVVQLDHRVVGGGLSVQGNPQPGAVLLLSENRGGQLSGEHRRTGSVDIDTADGTPPPEPVVADYVRGVREHLEPQVFLEVGGGPVELGDRVPGIRFRGLGLKPPPRLPSPGKPVEVFAAVDALEVLSPFLRGLVAAEAADKQQVVALVEGAVLLPEDPQRLFAAEVEKPQGAGVDLPGVDGPRREPAAVDAEDAVVSDPHLDPREGRVVPVAGAVETGALGRRPGGHSRRRIEEGAVQGGGPGTVRGRLETAAPEKRTATRRSVQTESRCSPGSYETGNSRRPYASTPRRMPRYSDSTRPEGRLVSADRGAGGRRIPSSSSNRASTTSSSTPAPGGAAIRWAANGSSTPAGEVSRAGSSGNASSWVRLPSVSVANTWRPCWRSRRSRRTRSPDGDSVSSSGAAEREEESIASRTSDARNGRRRRVRASGITRV